MNRQERKLASGSHKAICVVCSGPIPRQQVAMWVTDQWTGRIYGAHMHCGDGPEAQKAMLAGLKAAMTTPEWIRFRWRQKVMGQKRTWARFAARWTGVRKMVG